jgi:ParB/RepB/Spo0J family partition protein
MNADTFTHIPLKDLTLSQTSSQIERRKHFDKAAIAELAASLKTAGLVNPILTRRVNGHFEIVAGERRFLAAGIAGLEEIPATVRDLSDQQVLELQLIENLQREGLHAIAEAEGYETLMQQHGYTADELADKVGKSKAYIYARLKLTALAKPARKAFYDGKLNASTALLLARIPVESVQLQALNDITQSRFGEEVMSFREAAEHIHAEYMTRLDQAGFPTGSAELVPAAGACGPCPKRTGNQPQLFDDIKSADVCTDPTCFKAKREAWARTQLADAESKGKTVIAGKEAKKLAPYGSQSSVKGHVKLTERCYEDPKNRTYKQILGKDVEVKLLQDPESGQVIEIVSDSIAKAGIKAAGVKPYSSGGSGTQSAAEKKAKLERRVRQKLFAEVREKYPAVLARRDLEAIACGFFHEMQHETRKQLMALWLWEPVKKGYQTDHEKPFAAGVVALKDVELTKLLFDCVFICDLQVSTWSDAKPLVLLAAAKRFRVDEAKIRREITNAAITKKPAKKKVGKKK